MTDAVKATPTTLNGQPAVQIQPTNVPEGNLGGAGKIEIVKTPEQATEIAKEINEGKIDPTKIQTATPAEGQAKKLDKAA